MGTWAAIHVHTLPLRKYNGSHRSGCCTVHNHAADTTLNFEAICVQTGSPTCGTADVCIESPFPDVKITRLFTSGMVLLAQHSPWEGARAQTETYTEHCSQTTGMLDLCRTFDQILRL